MTTYRTRASAHTPGDIELVQVREHDDPAKVWTYIHELEQFDLDLGVNYYGEKLRPLVVWADSETNALEIGAHFLAKRANDAVFAFDLPEWAQKNLAENKIN